MSYSLSHTKTNHHVQKESMMSLVLLFIIVLQTELLELDQFLSKLFWQTLFGLMTSLTFILNFSSVIFSSGQVF